MKSISKLTLFTLILCAIISIAIGARASTLNLPESLIHIEDSAFEGDTSLDNVIIHEGTQTIGKCAFANSSVKTITLPNSLYFIADDAFTGVENLNIAATKGSYAYSWAVKEEFIKIDDEPINGETQIITPSILQAGANLQIQVIGASNTISHSIYLINTDTHKVSSQTISTKNGIATWYGCDLESGTYTIKVYTITDDYSTTTPVSKALTITGEKPAAPDCFEFPESLNHHYKFSIAPYDYLIIRWTEIDENNVPIANWDEGLHEDEAWIGPNCGGIRLDFTLSAYMNGLWSEWTSIQSISISYQTEEQTDKILNLQIPETILPGRDFEISFDCDDTIDRYEIVIEDENCDLVWYDDGQANNHVSATIGGYKIDEGTYHCWINVYEGQTYWNVYNAYFDVVGNRIPTTISITADKNEIYSDEEIVLSVNSNGIDGAYFRIVGNKTIYKGCDLTKDGNGASSTTFEGISNNTSITTVSICACVLIQDGIWSEWSDPITISVLKSEPLPEPIIHMSESCEAGKDLLIAISGIETADVYNVLLYEYYSDTFVECQTYSKTDSDFWNDVIFSGRLIRNGKYKVRVETYNFQQGQNSSEQIIRITGTQDNGPSVTTECDEILINSPYTFTIDTTDCEELYIEYKGNSPNSQSYYHEQFNHPITGNITNWILNISDTSCAGEEFEFKFTVKRDGKWTQTTSINRVFQELPSLEAPRAIMQDNIIAGEDMSITLEPVEHATTYSCRLEINGGERAFEKNFSDPSVFIMEGYEVIPARYHFIVTACADGFTTSKSEYDFNIPNNYKYTKESFDINLDKSIVPAGERNPLCTVNIEGALAIKYHAHPANEYGWYYDRVKRIDEDGNAQFYLEGYANDYETSTSWVYAFCVAYEDGWSEWTDVYNIIYYRSDIPSLTKLPETNIFLDTNIYEAGNDITFTFEPIENASYYWIRIIDNYTDVAIYSEEMYQNNTTTTISGYYMAPGTYTIEVSAYAERYERSISKRTFKVTGQRAEAPHITTEKENYTEGDNIIFYMDVQNAQEIYVEYRYCYNYEEINDYGYTYAFIPITESLTQWECEILNGHEGYTYEFKFSAKQNGKWSRWKKFVIPVTSETVE